MVIGLFILVCVIFLRGLLVINGGWWLLLILIIIQKWKILYCIMVMEIQMFLQQIGF